MRYSYLIMMLSLLHLNNIDPAMAEKMPRPSAADSRIKTFTYHESDVYKLRGHYGYSTVIELAPKEIIESVSIGDSESWQIVRAGRPNILFIKPILDNAHTNMTLITNKRMYTFDLSAQKAPSSQAHNLAFRVKFIYAQESDAHLARLSSSSKVSYDPFQGDDANSFNFEYSYSGDKKLRPTKAFDDGLLTYLSFAKHQTMPAIFEVQEDGSESLVNYTVKGKYLVIASIARQFTLRDGNIATCIFNEAYPQDAGTQHKVVPITSVKEKTINAEQEQQNIVLAMNVPFPPKKPDAFKNNEPRLFLNKFVSYLEPVLPAQLNE